MSIFYIKNEVKTRKSAEKSEKIVYGSSDIRQRSMARKPPTSVILERIKKYIKKCLS
jgi:hypothetical protein